MRRNRRAFSLTELLVVVAILMILASIFLVGSGELYRHANQVACASNLSELGKACLMFQNKTRQLPRAYGNGDGVGAQLRWYDVLAKYLDDQRVLTCPMQSGDYIGADIDERANLPIFYCCYGAGRMGRCFTQWGHYDSGRDWLKGVDNPIYPATSTPPEFPYPVESNPDAWGHAGITITPELLAGYSQFWVLPTVSLDIPGPNTADLPVQAEQDAVTGFVNSRGGVHIMAVSNPDGIRFVNALGNPVSMTGTVPKCGTYAPSSHPVMAGVVKLGANYNQTQMKLDLNDGAETIGTKTNGVRGVVAYDNGSGRVLVNHAIDTTMVYLPHYDFCSDNYDFKQYCINSAEWLRSTYESEGICSYGYNNQLGQDGATVAPNTIVLMDYHDWEVNRDGQGTDQDYSFIALRHGGRANCLLADGSIVPLTADEIEDAMFTPHPGNR